MIVSKKYAKPLIQSGGLVPVGVCVDADKGTFLIVDNLKHQRTDHIKIDSLAMDYSLECAIFLATL
jgi:hypothetical protein